MMFVQTARCKSSAVGKKFWLCAVEIAFMNFPPTGQYFNEIVACSYMNSFSITNHDPPDVIGLDKKIPQCHWLPRKQSPMMSLLHYLMLAFLFEISGCTKINSRIGSIVLPPHHPCIHARVSRWQ